MYSCCSTGKNTKTKVIGFSLIGIVIVVTSYFIFTATNNGSALVLSGVLGFAACPAMCAVMGGGIWIASRFGRKDNQKVIPENDGNQLRGTIHEHRDDDLTFRS